VRFWGLFDGRFHIFIIFGKIKKGTTKDQKKKQRKMRLKTIIHRKVQRRQRE
jgi:hypothetical protein